MNTKDNENNTWSCLCVRLTRVRVERRGRPTGGLSASGTKAEELLDVGGERLSPWSTGVIQKDGVNDEGQQPLTAVHPHLQTNRGEKLRGNLELWMRGWISNGTMHYKKYQHPWSDTDTSRILHPTPFFRFSSHSWHSEPQTLSNTPCFWLYHHRLFITASFTCGSGPIRHRIKSKEHLVIGCEQNHPKPFFLDLGAKRIQWRFRLTRDVSIPLGPRLFQSLLSQPWHYVCHKCYTVL